MSKQRPDHPFLQKNTQEEAHMEELFIKAPLKISWDQLVRVSPHELGLVCLT